MLPELWLADIQAPKPLENQLWSAPPNDVGRWLDAVDDKEFSCSVRLER